MADAIGSEYFIALVGEPDINGYAVEDITNKHIDGNAFRLLGKHSQQFTLTGKADVTSNTAAYALIDTYAAMRGSITSVTRAGVTRTNILVVDARVTEIKAIANAAGGLVGPLGAFLVTSQWVLQYAGT